MKATLAVFLLAFAGCAAETDEFQPDNTVEVEVVDEAVTFGSITFSSAASKLGVSLRYQKVAATGQIEAMTSPYIYKKTSTGYTPLVSLRYSDASFAYHDLCKQMSGQVLTNFDVYPNKILNLSTYTVIP